MYDVSSDQRLSVLSKHYEVTRKFLRRAGTAGTAFEFDLDVKPNDILGTGWLDRAITCAFAALVTRELEQLRRRSRS